MVRSPRTEVSAARGPHHGETRWQAAGPRQGAVLAADDPRSAKKQAVRPRLLPTRGVEGRRASAGGGRNWRAVTGNPRPVPKRKAEVNRPKRPPSFSRCVWSTSRPAHHTPRLRSRSCCRPARPSECPPDSIPGPSARSWPCWRAVDAQLAPDRADLPLRRIDGYEEGLRFARLPRRIGPGPRSVVGPPVRFPESSRRPDQGPLVGPGRILPVVQEASARLHPSSPLYRNSRTHP